MPLALLKQSDCGNSELASQHKSMPLREKIFTRTPTVVKERRRLQIVDSSLRRDASEPSLQKRRQQTQEAVLAGE